MKDVIPEITDSSHGQVSPVQRASSPAVSMLKALSFIAAALFGALVLLGDKTSSDEAGLHSLFQSVASMLPTLDRSTRSNEEADQAQREQVRQQALSSAPPSATPSPVANVTPPGALTRLVEKLPLPIETVFQSTLNLSPSGSQAQLSADGGVVLTSKYSVMRYGVGNPNDRQQLLSRDAYSSAFAGDRFQAVRSALAMPGGGFLTGGWHGEVLLKSAGQWRRISTREQAPQGSISAMAVWQNQAWVAGAGLWRLSATQDALEPITAVSALRRIVALLPAENALLFADRHRVWKYASGSAEIWSSGLPSGISITGLSRTAKGDIRVLSQDGIYRAGADGQFVSEHLPGVWVRQAQEIQGQLWVASWKQGLLLFEQGKWYRYGKSQGLASNSISDLLIDPKDHLWVVTYGEGGWQAPRAEAARRVLQFPWQVQADSD